MKPPSYWRDKICDMFVINTKEAGVIEKFISEVQHDARIVDRLTNVDVPYSGEEPPNLLDMMNNGSEHLGLISILKTASDIIHDDYPMEHWKYGIAQEINRILKEKFGVENWWKK